MEPAELVGAGVGELAVAGVGELALVVEVIVNEVIALALVVLVVYGLAAYERPMVDDRPQASQPWQWGDCPTRQLRATPDLAVKCIRADESEGAQSGYEGRR